MLPTLNYVAYDTCPTYCIMSKAFCVVITGKIVNVELGQVVSNPYFVCNETTKNFGMEMGLK